MPTSTRGRALLLALLVTFLWSTSWVLIKIGLREVPPLLFAGLRYGLASLCLLPWVLRSRRRALLGRLPRGGWVELAVLGVTFYSLTQGAQFVALAYLPANTVSLILTFSPLLVAGLGIVTLGEQPSRWQWAGALVMLAGAALYLAPARQGLPAGAAMAGYGAALVGLLANTASALLGRHLNRRGVLDPLTITAVSMAVGAALLLAAGAAERPPVLRPAQWALIAWLAVVNTAVAFPLWNHTLRTLSAVESSLINNTMLVQIAVLVWIFLGERVTWTQGLGLVLATAGVAAVQLRRMPGSRPTARGDMVGAGRPARSTVSRGDP